MNFKEKIKAGENRFLELKVGLPAKKQLAQTAVAYSNGAGGEIIIGVNDKREIIGIDEKIIDEYLDKITNVITDNCYPLIVPVISKLNIDNKLLIVVKIYPGSFKPYFIKSMGKDKGVYIRIGATNKIADKTILAELERQRLNISYDEEPAYQTRLNQFDSKKFIADFYNL